MLIGHKVLGPLSQLGLSPQLLLMPSSSRDFTIWGLQSLDRVFGGGADEALAAAAVLFWTGMMQC